MPQIDLAALELLRRKRGDGPRARSHRLALFADIARIDIMGDICPDFGISAASVAAQLNQITAPEILVRINSFGGDVYEGITIHNLLVGHPARIIAEIIGAAASVASWIAMAADEILIWENASLMIHQSWQALAGNADILEQHAVALRKIDEQMRAAYVSRTRIDDDAMRQMMRTDNWMSAEEAVTYGFADRVLRVGEQAKATIKAAAEPAKRAALTITPDVLAGLKSLAAAMLADRG